jgi:hypothetical protein
MRKRKGLLQRWREAHPDRTFYATDKAFPVGTVVIKDEKSGSILSIRRPKKKF